MYISKKFSTPKPKEPTKIKIENYLLAELKYKDVLPISEIPEDTTHISSFNGYDQYEEETTKYIECYKIVEECNHNYASEMVNYTEALGKFNVEMQLWENAKLDHENKVKMRTDEQDRKEYLRLKQKYGE